MLFRQNSNFQQKYGCLNLVTGKQEQRLYCLVSLSLYCWVWVNAYMLGLGSKDALNKCLPLLLCLWCWLWANMYYWNRDSFMSNLLCFTLQFILNFTTLIRVSMPFYHSRENFVFDSRLGVLYKKKLLLVKSNFWSSQGNWIL